MSERARGDAARDGWSVMHVHVLGEADADSIAHVNNSRYFLWFDAVRTELFERAGVQTYGSAIVPVLVTTTCDFFRALVPPATVEVSARVTKVGATSASFAYEISDGNGAYARATATAVLIDYATKQKVRLSDAQKAALEPA